MCWTSSTRCFDRHPESGASRLTRATQPATVGSPAKRSASRGMYRVAALRALPALAHGANLIMQCTT
ncbi:hypothetical protein Q6324_28130, partial [Klebsiella pneumoniae]|uniref:hypothetical protein n=1 Tax=Klebsiella pneumoniae TaxID=573 RepID=UPI002730C46E